MTIAKRVSVFSRLRFSASLYRKGIKFDVCLYENGFQRVLNGVYLANFCR